MEDQIVHAIETAFNPAVDQALIHQALQYVEQLRSEQSAWQPCLTIFTRNPRYSQVVRHMCLDIVGNAVRSANVGHDGLGTARARLLAYLRETYGSADPSLAEIAGVQNKVAQILTDFFALFYSSGWERFFDDLLELTSTTNSGNWDNAAGIVFYLRVLISIHDDIGDNNVSRSLEEQKRATLLKDLIRQRDVQRIAQSWQGILLRWGEENDLVAELCLKAVGRYVGWIDISLVVNQSMIDLLFQQLGRAQKTQIKDDEERARDAAINVFADIVSKKMKPADKIEMISLLNLENVITQLIAAPPLNQRRFSSQYDTDLAETVAALVDVTVVDIVKALETENQETTVWQRAEAQLQAFLPLVLRFFSDEYDEVCSTVIRSLNDILTYLRKSAKEGSPSPQRAVMLLPILKALIAKIRYDETSSWGDDDEETDEAEFQELRKRLNVLQQIIAATDEQLYIDVLADVVGRTFDGLRTHGTQLDWRDLDLALHEMYQFGDLAVKQGGLYSKNKPNSQAAEKLVGMMLRLVESDIRSFNHPATQLQYMEIVVRYSTFFEHHTQFITPVLENFIRLVHHPVLKVKTRSWYLFQRLARHLRAHVGGVAQTLIEALSDLLTIQAELPPEGADGEDMSSEDHDSSADAIFSSQLYLFEAIGCICGSPALPLDKQVFFAQSVLDPIFSDMERNLQSAKNGDERSVLQIHHDVMALGTVAAGFSDRTPSTTSAASAVPGEVQAAFARVSEATLVALETLKTSFDVRSAARFAFSRLVPVLGSNILPQLPRWIEGLLTQTSTKDEMALFLRLLDQVIFGFKTEIYAILETLLTPFLQRVFTGIAGPVSGTDDEIQLAELKREYLNFLLVVLNNELSAVLVSAVNQPMFDTVISTIEHFTKDLEDFPTAKMAFQVLARMSSVWGGPDIIIAAGQPNGTPTSSQAALPGFDRFMFARFSPLCWALPMTPSFNPKDAQAKQVLAEAANLQKVIFGKTGHAYLSWLRHTELRNLNMNDEVINEYLRQLEGLDQKGFRQYFQNFVQSASA